VPVETAQDEERAADLRARTDALLAEHPPGSVSETDFLAAQFDAGLAWVHFPAGLGGSGWPAALQEVVDARLRAAGAPSNKLRNFVGVGTAAPTLLANGSDEQRRRFLRPLFSCEEIWCQLFSEPDAGSDLAALRTRAVRDGDHWIVTGHKVWTTMAHRSRWGLLIARTNPDVPKHRGLTVFVVDMRDPGVTVRPIRQISGEAEFNEVLLADVVVPDSDRIGPVDEGWQVTMATLMSERAHNGEMAKKPRGFGPIAHALRLWADHGGAPGPVLRDRLVQNWIETEAIRLTAARAEQRSRAGTQGSEASVLKLVIGRSTQQVMDLCMDLAGDDALLISDYVLRQPDVTGETNMGDGTEEVDIAKAFLNARSSTVGGGTTEMQLNAIAERILGLPRDPTPVRPIPGR
jgi:alkylation response protein AidB-like acyl-CoA dehydrogenase